MPKKKKSSHQGCQNNIQSAFDKVLAIQLPAVSKSRILKALWEKKSINTDKRITTSVTYLHLSSYIFFKTIQNTVSSHNPFVLRPYIPVVFNKKYHVFNFQLLLLLFLVKRKLVPWYGYAKNHDHPPQWQHFSAQQDGCIFTTHWWSLRWHNQTPWPRFLEKPHTGAPSPTKKYFLQHHH